MNEHAAVDVYCVRQIRIISESQHECIATAITQVIQVLAALFRSYSKHVEGRAEHQFKLDLSVLACTQQNTTVFLEAEFLLREVVVVVYCIRQIQFSSESQNRCLATANIRF